MASQHVQKIHKPVHLPASYWLWVGMGVLLIVAVIAIQTINRPALMVINLNPSTAVDVQAVPEAAVQGVANYLQAHKVPSAQTVPEAAALGVANYLQAHGNAFAQVVPEAGVQSVTNYIRLHTNDITTAMITDPTMWSVMEYLKAHGIQP